MLAYVDQFLSLDFQLAGSERLYQLNGNNSHFTSISAPVQNIKTDTNLIGTTGNVSIGNRANSASQLLSYHSSPHFPEIPPFQRLVKGLALEADNPSLRSSQLSYRTDNGCSPLAR